MSILFGYVSALSANALQDLGASGVTKNRVTIAVYKEADAVPGGATNSLALFAGDPELQVAADIRRTAGDLLQKIRIQTCNKSLKPNEQITDEDVRTHFPEEYALTYYALAAGAITEV